MVQVSFDVNVEHPFNDIIEATCRGLYGASVDVRRGSALMFDSMLVRGVLRTFHADSRRKKGVWFL